MARERARVRAEADAAALGEDLKRCLNSIFEKSTYENYEIIIVENGSTEEATKRYYREVGLLKE